MKNHYTCRFVQERDKKRITKFNKIYVWTDSEDSCLYMNDKIDLKMVRGINLIETSNYIGNEITHFKNKPEKLIIKDFFLLPDLV